MATRTSQTQTSPSTCVVILAPTRAADPLRHRALGALSKGISGNGSLIGIEPSIGSDNARGDLLDHSGAVAPATGTPTNLTSDSRANRGDGGWQRLHPGLARK